MNSTTVRKVSIGALTIVGALVALNMTPSKKGAVYWGITDQLDQMNEMIGAVEVGKELRAMAHDRHCDEGGSRKDQASRLQKQKDVK